MGDWLVYETPPSYLTIFSFQESEFASTSMCFDPSCSCPTRVNANKREEVAWHCTSINAAIIGEGDTFVSLTHFMKSIPRYEVVNVFILIFISIRACKDVDEST